MEYSDDRQSYFRSLIMATIFGLSGLEHYSKPEESKYLEFFDEIRDIITSGKPSVAECAFPRFEQMVDEKNTRDRILELYSAIFEAASRAREGEISPQQIQDALDSGDTVVRELVSIKNRYREELGVYSYSGR